MGVVVFIVKQLPLLMKILYLSMEALRDFHSLILVVDLVGKKFCQHNLSTFY